MEPKKDASEFVCVCGGSSKIRNWFGSRHSKTCRHCNEDGGQICSHLKMARVLNRDAHVTLKERHGDPGRFANLDQNKVREQDRLLSLDFQI